MRLDKYLKVSRLIKRRTVANEACDNGRISVNGRRHPALHGHDAMGNPFSYIEVQVRPGRSISCTVKE